MVGIQRIRQREAQRPTSRLAMRSVAISERIRRRSGNYSNVNVNFTVLDRLPTASMRTQNARAAHLSLCTVIAERTVHAAFDVIDHARLHQFDRALLRGERCAGKPRQILYA